MNPLGSGGAAAGGSHHAPGTFGGHGPLGAHPSLSAAGVKRKEPEGGIDRNLALGTSFDGQQARRSFPSLPSRAVPGVLHVGHGTEAPARPAVPIASATSAPAVPPQPLPPPQGHSNPPPSSSSNVMETTTLGSATSPTKPSAWSQHKVPAKLLGPPAHASLQAPPTSLLMSSRPVEHILPAPATRPAAMTASVIASGAAPTAMAVSSPISKVPAYVAPSKAPGGDATNSVAAQQSRVVAVPKPAPSIVQPSSVQKPSAQLIQKPQPSNNKPAAPPTPTLVKPPPIQAPVAPPAAPKAATVATPPLPVAASNLQSPAKLLVTSLTNTHPGVASSPIAAAPSRPASAYITDSQASQHTPRSRLLQPLPSELLSRSKPPAPAPATLPLTRVAPPPSLQAPAPSTSTKQPIVASFKPAPVAQPFTLAPVPSAALPPQQDAAPAAPLSVAAAKPAPAAAAAAKPPPPAPKMGASFVSTKPPPSAAPLSAKPPPPPTSAAPVPAKQPPPALSISTPPKAAASLASSKPPPSVLKSAPAQQPPPPPRSTPALPQPPAALPPVPEVIVIDSDIPITADTSFDDMILPDEPPLTPAEQMESMKVELRRLTSLLLHSETAAREKIDLLEKQRDSLQTLLASRQAAEQKRVGGEAQLQAQMARLQTELARANAVAAEARAKAAAAVAAAATAPPPPSNDETRAIAAKVANLQSPPATVVPGKPISSALGTAHLLKKLFFRSQPKCGLAALFSGSGTDEAHSRKAQELQVALSTAMNPDASPVLLLSPLYNFTLSTDAQIVENALELVLLLVQSSNDVRKAMLGAAHAEQQKPTRVPEEFSRLSVHPLVPRNPRIRIATPIATEPPSAPPSTENGKAYEILRHLINRLPTLQRISGIAIEQALCIISTALDRCSVVVLKSLEDVLLPLLRKEGDTVFIVELLRTASPALSERVVEFISAIIPYPPLFTQCFQVSLHRLVKLLHVSATASTLPARRSSFQYALELTLLLGTDNEHHLLDRLVVMLENELDQCCVYPGPAGRIPNAASRLFVAETCYLLWQCMSAAGSRAVLSQKVPLQAIASRLVLGELDPELRGLATFGMFFINFQYSTEGTAQHQENSQDAAHRDRDRSEGYSSR